MSFNQNTDNKVKALDLESLSREAPDFVWEK